MKKLLAVLIAAMMAVSLLAGCSSGGGSDTLIVSQGADPASLDPQGANEQPGSRVSKQIYDTLFFQDEEMNVSEGLAESYELLDDGMTLSLKLREGVTFHNGNAFTAEDVKFTIERAIASPDVTHIVSAIDPEKITIVDDYNMTIGMLYPFAPILSHLAHTATSIVDKETVEAAGDSYGSSPVGTGPYTLVEWNVGDNIVLEANADYWGEGAKTENIIIRNIPEPETAMLELESGGVDIVYDIAASNIARFEGSEETSLVRSPNFSTTYIGFNAQKEPFNDPLVRQAINHAIDMSAIVENVYYGAGSQAKGPIGQMVWAYNDELTGYEYDVEKAKELLAEAGYPDGFSTTIMTNEGNQQRADVAIIVQSALKEIGIEVEIQTLEWTKYLETTENGEHDMFILGWVTVTGDPDYGLYPLFHSSTYGAAGNRTFWSTPEVDELLDEARTSNDPAVREANYKEVQQIVAEEAPWIFTWEGEDLTGVRSNIEGFVNNPAGHHVLKNVVKN